MRKTIYFLVAIAFAFSSCKKENVKPVPLASLFVGNFKISGKAVKIGNNPATVFNNSWTQISVSTGESDLYVWPSGDSLHPYFVKNKWSRNERDIYSLFLCDDTLTPNGILIKENIPYHTDSTAGIRFINLSPNSTPLNITLSTSTNVYEVSNLAYKDATAFLSYPGYYNSAYTFQVRAANNPSVILASFPFTANTVPRFANVSLVIRGKVGGSPAIGVSLVYHDR